MFVEFCKIFVINVFIRSLRNFLTGQVQKSSKRKEKKNICQENAQKNCVFTVMIHTRCMTTKCAAMMMAHHMVHAMVGTV